MKTLKLENLAFEKIEMEKMKYLKGGTEPGEDDIIDDGDDMWDDFITGDD